MENLSKRIAQALANDRAKKKPLERKEPKVKPEAKILDKLYEAIHEQESEGALDLIYDLTIALDLQDDVSFEVPEEEQHETPEDEMAEHGEPFGTEPVSSDSEYHDHDHED